MTTDRNLSRYLVNWRIALIYDRLGHKPTYHGRTRDLTLGGTGMLTTTNVFDESPVVVLLAIPPLHRNGRQEIVEIRAQQVYSVYSGETFCFRLGLEFLSFKDDGFDILKEGLTHYRPVIEVADGDSMPGVFGSSPLVMGSGHLAY